MQVMKTGEDIHGILKGEENHNFKIYPGNPSYGMTALRELVEHMGLTLKITEEKIQNLKADMKGQEELAEQPFEFADQLIKAQSRYAEIMAELNPGGAAIVVDDDAQEESRDFLEDEGENEAPKKHCKQSRYSSSETAFMIWANGSASEGDARRFVRSGKVRYYEKTADGCVEISAGQYSERTGFSEQDIDRRAQRKVSGAIDQDGSKSRNAAGSASGDRNPAGVQSVSGHSVGEQLRNDVGRSVPGDGRSAGGDSESVSGEQNQPRVEPLTDRDILLTAAQDITGTALTDGERDALDIFKSRLDKLGALQEKRQALGTLYKEQQFGKHVDRETAKKTLEEMRRYDGLIQKANEKVISAETSPALRKVLPRARAVIEQAQKAKDDATLARWRDRRDNAAVQFILIFFIMPDLLIFKISIKNQAHRRFSQISQIFRFWIRKNLEIR